MTAAVEMRQICQREPLSDYRLGAENDKPSVDGSKSLFIMMGLEDNVKK